MKRKQRFSILQISRIVLQILFFIFLPSLYFETLTGVKQLYLALIHQKFSPSLWPQLAAAIVIIPATVIAGRFFCGWMCAFGSFTDFIYRISQKIFHKKIRISEKWDGRMKFLKYVVLLLMVVASWTFGAAFYQSANPWDVFGMVATVGKAPALSYVVSNLTVGFAVFLLIIAASAFSERFFCRYLCPMGAVFSLVSRPKIVKIEKPSANCGNCRACTNRCAMGIPLYRMDSVDNGECIGCMKCVSVCPRRNVGVTVSGGDVRPLAAGLTAAAVVTGFYYTSDLALNKLGSNVLPAASQSTASQSAAGQSGQAAQNGMSQSSSAVSPSGQYKDGTYQGSGSGFRGGTTTVTVVVAGGKITSVQADSSEDSPNFFNAAYTTVSGEIISSQSANVNAVSGATYSSRGIMEAVADALKTARV